MIAGSDERTQIEQSIENARKSVGKRVDEIDRKLRGELDVRRFASEHAPQLVAAGAALGFLVACGPRRAVIRMLQVGVPIAIAATIVKRVIEQAEEEPENRPLTPA